MGQIGTTFFFTFAKESHHMFIREGISDIGTSLVQSGLVGWWNWLSVQHHHSSLTQRLDMGHPQEIPSLACAAIFKAFQYLSLTNFNFPLTFDIHRFFSYQLKVKAQRSGLPHMDHLKKWRSGRFVPKVSLGVIQTADASHDRWLNNNQAQWSHSHLPA